MVVVMAQNKVHRKSGGQPGHIKKQNILTVPTSQQLFPTAPSICGGTLGGLSSMSGMGGSGGNIMDNPEQFASFIQGARSGLSNDATALMGLNDICGGEELEDEDVSSDSLLNSHRRSRS